MLFLIITMIVWLGAVIMSFVNGRRKLPGTILVLGVLDIFAILFLNIGWLGVAPLAIMAAVLLLANKWDSVMG